MRPFLDAFADCMAHQEQIPMGSYEETGDWFTYHAPHRDVVMPSEGYDATCAPNLIVWTGSGHRYGLLLKDE